MSNTHELSEITVCVITGTVLIQEIHTYIRSRNFSYWGLGIIKG